MDELSKADAEGAGVLQGFIEESEAEYEAEVEIMEDLYAKARSAMAAAYKKWMKGGEIKREQWWGIMNPMDELLINSVRKYQGQAWDACGLLTEHQKKKMGYRCVPVTIEYEEES